MKNLISFTILILSMKFASTSVIPRILYTTQDLKGRVLLHSNLQKTKDLDLHDISNTLYKFIDQNNLKLLSQGIGAKSIEYDINTPSDRKLLIKVEKNSDNFKIDLKQKDSNFNKSINVKQRYYSLNEIQNFLNNSFNSLKQDLNKKIDRSLAGKKVLKLNDDEWKKLIQTVLTTKFKVDGEKKDNFKVFKVEPSDLWYKISITGEEGNIMIKIFNDDLEENDDHHARFERKIVDSDDEGKLEDYIGTTHSEMEKILERKNKGDIKSLSDEIRKKLSTYTFDEIVADRNYKIKKGDAYIGNLFLYEIKNYFTVTVKLSDSEFDMMIPQKKSDWNITLDGLETQFKKATENQPPLDFKSAVTKLLDKIKENCKFEEKDKGDITYEKLTINHLDLAGKIVLPGSNNCVLEEGTILFEIFQFGYIQFLHFYFDSSFLKTEYMIGLNNKDESFKKRSGIVIQELIKQVDAVIKGQQAGTEDVEITMDLIKTTLDESGAGKCEQKTGNVNILVCHYGNTGKSAFVESKVNKASKFFRIELSNSIFTKNGGDFADNPVYYLQERNGYDQLALFGEKAKEFFENQTQN